MFLEFKDERDFCAFFTGIAGGGASVPLRRGRVFTRIAGEGASVPLRRGRVFTGIAGGGVGVSGGGKIRYEKRKSLR